MISHRVVMVFFLGGGAALVGLLLFSFLVMYPLVVRPLDKKLPPMQQYLLERGVFFQSLNFRLIGYVLGTVLQPYRGKDKRGLLGRMTRGRFEYQDAVYGEKVNYRQYLNRFQIGLCCFFFWYVLFVFLLVLIWAIVFQGILHVKTP